MPEEPAPVLDLLRFGRHFELDRSVYTLRRAGQPVKLERIPLEILLFLLEQRGRLVTREEIAEKIWGKDVFVDTDNNINSAIRKIRQALDDDPEQPRFVQTVTGRGYRFLAPVDVGKERWAGAAPQPHASEQASAGAMPQRAVPRWPIIAGAVVLLAGALAAWYLWSSSRARLRTAGGRAMLAVLPFENLTGDASQDYFSDGMTEELITELGRFNSARFGVIARTSVMLYRHSSKPLDQIGRELGVQYVVEGSVRRDAGRVRITAQLIQVNDQTHLWARQYDREIKDLLVVQSEIARGISDEIQATLGYKQPVPLIARPPLSPPQEDAHDLYLKGRYFWGKRTDEGFQQSVIYFQQAIAKDPDYAQAYAGLADTYALMSTWSEGPQNELMPKARAAALKALSIDEGLAEPHSSLALIAEAYDYDWKTAEKEFRRAIELNPDYATAHHWYAEYLSWQGRFDQALAESERARQLDPLSFIIATDRAAIFYVARQYDRAIAQSRIALEMNPDSLPAASYMGQAYLQDGRCGEALDTLKQAPDGHLGVLADKVYLHGQCGRIRDAHDELAKLEELARKRDPAPTWALVRAYAGTKQSDKIIALLQKGYAEHSFNFGPIKVDPMYDPLRNDPRFQELLRHLGLAQ